MNTITKALWACLGLIIVFFAGIALRDSFGLYLATLAFFLSILLALGFAYSWEKVETGKE